MNIKLDNFALIPTRAHVTDAGLDLMSPVDVTIPARDSVVIDTGVHVELPEHSVGLLLSKSGLNVNFGITSEGVIDAGYTGAIKVKLYNNSDYDYNVHRGNKISQLVIVPCFIPYIEEEATMVSDLRGGNNG